ncbi:hypothetical protein [Goekera deserti]|uniref:Uncharacterized protein n=1 Tax=Goekera deserti TaxID=2497753 RepID=A0A7K3WEZ4_9ACTN|nr:hypothetical protein [Goekera deserti]NDI48654.1 hypothetical protein [Goekera deserti]NEL54967.1 hypothetical protein [Goekera deserti]
MGRLQRGRHVPSLLIVDADHVEASDDGDGHPAGDACPQRLAVVLERCTGELEPAAGPPWSP